MATSVSKNSTNSCPHAVDVTSYDARGYILPFCYEGASKVLNIKKMSSVHPSTQSIPYVLDWIQVWAICWPWQDVDVVLPQVRPKKKICVFTVRRPSLIFGPDPKLFYCTFSRKLFKYPILPSNVVFHV